MFRRPDCISARFFSKRVDRTVSSPSSESQGESFVSHNSSLPSSPLTPDSPATEDASLCAKQDQNTQPSKNGFENALSSLAECAKEELALKIQTVIQNTRSKVKAGISLVSLESIMELEKKNIAKRSIELLSQINYKNYQKDNSSSGFIRDLAIKNNYQNICFADLQGDSEAEMLGVLCNIARMEYNKYKKFDNLVVKQQNTIETYKYLENITRALIELKLVEAQKERLPRHISIYL